MQSGEPEDDVLGSLAGLANPHGSHARLADRIPRVERAFDVVFGESRVAERACRGQARRLARYRDDADQQNARDRRYLEPAPRLTMRAPVMASPSSMRSTTSMPLTTPPRHVKSPSLCGCGVIPSV